MKTNRLSAPQAIVSGDVQIITVDESSMVANSVNGAVYHAPCTAMLDYVERAIRRGVRRIGPGTYIVW